MNTPPPLKGISGKQRTKGNSEYVIIMWDLENYVIQRTDLYKYMETIKTEKAILLQLVQPRRFSDPPPPCLLRLKD